jgi:hypothetical protein
VYASLYNNEKKPLVAGQISKTSQEGANAGGANAGKWCVAIGSRIASAPPSPRHFTAFFCYDAAFPPGQGRSRLSASSLGRAILSVCILESLIYCFTLLLQHSAQRLLTPQRPPGHHHTFGQTSTMFVLKNGKPRPSTLRRLLSSSRAIASNQQHVAYPWDPPANSSLTFVTSCF